MSFWILYIHSSRDLRWLFFLRQYRFLKGMLFVHFLNVLGYKLILCNESKISPRQRNIQVSLLSLKEGALIYVTCINLPARHLHNFLMLRLGRGVLEITQLCPGRVDKWLQEAHAAGVRWQARKETRKMYTNAQWCTCRKKEVTDRWTPTLRILPHLDIIEIQYFSIITHLTLMNSLKRGNLIRVENVEICPYCCYMTLLFTSVPQKTWSGSHNSVSR